MRRLFTPAVIAIGSIALVWPAATAAPAMSTAPTSPTHQIASKDKSELRPVTKTRRNHCRAGGVRWTLRVTWKDFGRTVEPTFVRVGRGAGRGLDWTVRYFGVEESWWRRSGRSGHKRAKSWDAIDSQVSTHHQSVKPRVRAYMGPFRSDEQCRAVIPLLR